MSAGAYGETANGIEVYAYGGSDQLSIRLRSGGTGPTLATSGADTIAFIAGKTYSFVIVDDGAHVTATITQLDDLANTATVSAASSYVGSGNHVVFHNREAANLTAYLDNVSIDHPDAPLVTPEDVGVVVGGIVIGDSDAGSGIVDVTLSVTEGTLTVKDDVGGGLGAGAITDNGSGTVVLSGTLAAINATLADANGLTYQGALDFNGTDTLLIDVDDNGNTGDGGAMTAEKPSTSSSHR